MKKVVATTVDELRALPVHDARLLGDEPARDLSQSTLTVQFAQEPLFWDDDDVVEYEVVATSPRSTRYRVPLMSCRLTIRHVVAVRADDDWDAAGSVLDFDFDADAGEVVLDGGGVLAARVGALEVEAVMTDEVAMHLRRDVGGLLGGQYDAPWKETDRP